MISLNKFDAIFATLEDKCPYKLGAKFDFKRNPFQQVGRFIDCSGFVSYIYFYSNTDGPKLVDGSVNQRAWVEAQGWRKLEKYSDVQYAANDESRLFICFIKPLFRKAGHVWFVKQGKTLESYGGHGVGSRHWNQLVFKLRGAVAYEVPTC